MPKQIFNLQSTLDFLPKDLLKCLLQGILHSDKQKEFLDKHARTGRCIVETFGTGNLKL